MTRIRNTRGTRNSINSKNGKNGKNNVIKNEFYYLEQQKLKKMRLIKCGVVACMALGVYLYVRVPYGVDIDSNQEVVSWKLEKGKNPKGITYELIKNGKVVQTGTKLKYMDDKEKDNKSPNNIDTVEVFKREKSIAIRWKAPLDKGVENTYQVWAINEKGKKQYKSKEHIGNITSGIDYYIVKYDGKEFKTESAEFKIDTTELKSGAYSLEIQAIDNNGNKSGFKKFSFEISQNKFKVVDKKLVAEDKNLNNDKYIFSLIKDSDVSDESETLDEFKNKVLLGEDISKIFSYNSKPEMSNPVYLIENNNLEVFWSSSKDSDASHSFYIETINKQTLEKTYSEVLQYETNMKISGFHYTINNLPNYVVQATDAYTEDNRVKFDFKSFDRNKKYYFHIASLDEDGIFSDTKTLEMDLQKFISTEDKLSLVRTIVDKSNSNISNVYYKRVVDEIYNKYTYDTINKLKSSKFKIILINENLKNYVNTHYKINTENEYAVYLKNKNVLIYYVNTPFKDLHLELMKNFDLMKKDSWSSSEEFKNLYKKEKAILEEKTFTIISTYKEYFANSMYLMMINDSEFKEYAPLTYEFLKANYNKILFI